jgi:hypothetical protein
MTAGRAFLIAPDGPAINQSRLWLTLKGRDLCVQRIRQTNIIIVQKAQVFTTARNHANISRSGYTLVMLDANVLDPGKSLAYFGCFIHGGIVDYHYLDVMTRSLCAVHGPR